MLTLEQLGISEEDWNQTPASGRVALMFLLQQNRRLENRCATYELQVQRLKAELQRLKKLELEVAELRERLGQNSQNSSKPPSSDPPSVSRPNNHQPSGRKCGGQLGHQGRARKLLAPEEVDTIIELRPTACQQCGHLLMGNDPDPLRHQVSEIPRSAPQVTEYRRHTLSRPACGFVNCAEWPQEIRKGSFGPRVRAIVAFLTGRLGVSQRDAVGVLQTVHGLKISLGSISAIQRQVSLALEQAVQAAQAYVQRQPVNCVDETTWPESGAQRWLWVNATEKATIFKLLAGRSQSEARQFIGSDCAGIATTDRFGAYNWLGQRRRQVCWAHLKRDFQCFTERGGGSEKIGEQLLDQVREIFSLWHKMRDGLLARPEFVRAMKSAQGRVGALLREGAASDHPKTQRTCRNLLGVETTL